MSPEQITVGDEVEIGPATDVYALGTIFYEMLREGRRFRAIQPSRRWSRYENHDPPPPRRLRPRLPRDFETICLKCLEKDPARRFRSATALADDLARASAGRPIVARRVRFSERAMKWIRRQPVVTSLIAAVVAVTVAGTWGVSLAMASGQRGLAASRTASAGRPRTPAKPELGAPRTGTDTVSIVT